MLTPCVMYFSLRYPLALRPLGQHRCDYFTFAPSLEAIMSAILIAMLHTMDGWFFSPPPLCILTHLLLVYSLAQDFEENGIPFTIMELKRSQEMQ